MDHLTSKKDQTINRVKSITKKITIFGTILTKGNPQRQERQESQENQEKQEDIDCFH